ncbi:hypothetical protein KIK06_04565 [Nocardiopsis sp. EMB25]|nr:MULTISPECIES: hypothetical protein [Nocardiopsis]MCY9783163.1 hypothetical protein [Nocardiopsis sp. EMB25]
MNDRIPPIGPLALALRLSGASRRTVLLIAALAATALLAGIGLLLI